MKEQVLGKGLWGDFIGLFPTESLTASTLLGHLVVNFLPDLGFYAFLLGLFTDPELCQPNDEFAFSGDNC